MAGIAGASVIRPRHLRVVRGRGDTAAVETPEDVIERLCEDLRRALRLLPGDDPRRGVIARLLALLVAER